MHVVKVGGSLLTLPDLPQRLSAFLPAIVVPGGGALADVIRELDRIHRIGEERSHWLALRACALNAHVLATLTGLPVVVRPEPGILDPLAFANADEGRPGALPHCWEATSDSVAARVAEVTGLPLLMLKSTGAETADVVDPLFPTLVLRGGLKVTFHNLRAVTSDPENQ